MAEPKRQREVGYALCDNPELSGKPSELAQAINCSPLEAKLALYKLRKRLGGRINAETLCPECLLHTRFHNVCDKCGLEYPPSPSSLNFDGRDRSDHEIFNLVNEGYNEAPPIKMSVQTLSFLRNGRSQEEKLRSYCLSRMAQLLKQDPAINPFATNQAALCTKRAVREFIQSKPNQRRIEFSDKLAIVTKALLQCLDKLPQYNAMWKDALGKLLSNPEVILYASS